MKNSQTEPNKVLSTKTAASESVKKMAPSIKLEYLPPEPDEGLERFDELLKRAAKPKK